MRTLAPLAALALVAPAAAVAGVPISASLRVGYGWTAGTAYEDPATGAREGLDDELASGIPIQLDVAWRLRPELAVGVYGSFAADHVGGAVDATCVEQRLTCSAHTFRLGVEATYRLPALASSRLVPWVGLGIGWEWTSFEQAVPGARYQVSYDGLELLGLQLGAEYDVNERFGVGPYALVSLGTYTGLEQSATGYGSEELPIARAVHVWASVGIRGRYSW